MQAATARVILRDYENEEKVRRNAKRIVEQAQATLEISINSLAIMAGNPLKSSVLSLEKIFEGTKFGSDKRVEIFNGSIEITVNKFALVEVLENLVQNAFKANATKVEISCEEIENYSIIQVKDNGSGISSDVIDLIFGEYSSRPGGGTGLQIVKTLVSSMGAEIDLHSQINQGTTFSIKIPS